MNNPGSQFANASQGHPRLDAPMPVIKVIGLGGGGSNAVDRMIQIGLEEVEFIAANTDQQSLEGSLASIKLQLGPRVTRGLGAGGDPRAGAAAAMESSRELGQLVKDADLVFLTAGMGGGTGTGSIPVVAEIAREAGALVIAVVTLPFGFEMNRRARNAIAGVRKLQPHANTLITVPNDRLLQIAPQDLSLEVAFRLADDVLRQGVQGVAEVVTKAGLINVDFSNVRRLLETGGGSLLSIGMGKGRDKAHAAIHQALHHPLVELEGLETATGLLLHFTGGEDLTLHEIGDAVSALRAALPEQSDLVLGASTEPSMAGRAQAILIVTGIGAHTLPVAEKAVQEERESRKVSEAPEHEPDDLDLPTFLRRRLTLNQEARHG